MKTIEGSKYIEEVGKIRRSPMMENLDDASKKEVAAMKEIADSLAYLQSETQKRITMVVDGAPAGVGGWVTSADRGNNRVFVPEHMVTSDWAMHVMKHESEHKRNGFFGFPIQQRVTPEAAVALEDALQLSDLGAYDFVEGFTEFITISQNGFANDSGYAENEVPAAQKLEKLCMDELGFSLKEHFHTSNEGLLFQKLQELGDKLRLKHAQKGIVDTELKDEDLKKAGLSYEQFLMALEERVQAEKSKGMFAHRKADELAEDFRKISSEILEVGALRHMLAANGNVSEVAVKYGILA